MEFPEIALVSPPIIGHNKRGTGVYTENLYSILKNNKSINVSLVNIETDLKTFNLVHFPYFDPFFLTLPLFRTYRTVVTVHDLIPLKYPDKFPKGLKGSLKWEIQKLSLKKAQLIITDSEASKSDISEITGIKKEKIKVISLGVNKKMGNIQTPVILKNVKEALNLPEKFFLYVGDVNYNKNIPGLIKAFKKVAENKPSYFLVLVGNGFTQPSGNLSEIINLINELKLNKNIKRYSELSDNELNVLYNSAEIYLQPSLDEGFGLPVLEAFASGCPVISSDSGSLPEITGDAALKIDPYDIQSMAVNMIMLTNNQELRKELKGKGFKQVQKFSWEQCAKETVREYLNVIADKT